MSEYFSLYAQPFGILHGHLLFQWYLTGGILIQEITRQYSSRSL